MLKKQQSRDLDLKGLRDSLLKFQESFGRGAWTALQELTGVHASGIAKISKGVTKPTPETWNKLYYGAPEIVQKPPWINDEPRKDETIITFKNKDHEKHALVIEGFADHELPLAINQAEDSTDRDVDLDSLSLGVGFSVYF